VGRPKPALAEIDPYAVFLHPPSRPTGYSMGRAGASGAQPELPAAREPTRRHRHRARVRAAFGLDADYADSSRRA